MVKDGYTMTCGRSPWSSSGAVTAESSNLLRFAIEPDNRLIFRLRAHPRDVEDFGTVDINGPLASPIFFRSLFGHGCLS